MQLLIDLTCFLACHRDIWTEFCSIFLVNPICTISGAIRLLPSFPILFCTCIYLAPLVLNEWYSVCHVEVVGRPLLPEYDVDIIDQSGKCILKYFPNLHESSSTSGEMGHSHGRAITSRVVRRGVHELEHIVWHTLLGGGVFADEDWIDVYEEVAGR